MRRVLAAVLLAAAVFSLSGCRSLNLPTHCPQQVHLLPSDPSADCT